MAINDFDAIERPREPAAKDGPDSDRHHSFDRAGGSTPPPDDRRSAWPTTPPTLRRSKHDQVIGGVCGGLGIATGVDPVWFRLGFVVLALSSGVGILAYIVAWILIPEETEDRPALRQPGFGPGAGSVVAGVALLTLGVVLFIDVMVPWFDRHFWPLALIAVGGALLYVGSRR